MPTHTIEIRPADSVPQEELLAVLNAAYSDYFVPVRLSRASFQAMVSRESVLLDASRVAVTGGQVVGIGLMAVRDQHGWVGGMGVIPAYRRQGIGRRLMQALVETARARELTRLQLEVITRNEGAIALYETFGFQPTRRLLVLNRQGDTPIPDVEAGEDLRFRPARQPTVEDALQTLPAPERPWQRQYAARRGAPRVAGLAAYEHGERTPAAVCLYRGSATLCELLDVAAQTPEVGAALLHYLITRYAGSVFSYLNVAEDDPLLPALFGLGFSDVIDQYEMILNLNEAPSS